MGLLANHKIFTRLKPSIGTCPSRVVSTLLLYFQLLLNAVHETLRSWTQKPNRSHEQETKEVSVGDIKVVLDRLEILYNDEGDRLQERYDASELSRLFEIEEPGLEELKEAFNIFDENKDGFIDAVDMQRILRSLGLKEDSQQLTNCERTIREIKKKGDGSIDFSDFVGFMDKCL